jgi:hypothetical protein
MSNGGAGGKFNVRRGSWLLIWRGWAITSGAGRVSLGLASSIAVPGLLTIIVHVARSHSCLSALVASQLSRFGEWIMPEPGDG